jgi:predicted transcriptional regulator
MAAKGVFTVRVSSELQDRLDAIAEAIDRPRSWVVNRAIEAFVGSETWQIEEIKRGLAEADAGSNLRPVPKLRRHSRDGSA